MWHSTNNYKVKVVRLQQIFKCSLREVKKRNKPQHEKYVMYLFQMYNGQNMTKDQIIFNFILCERKGPEIERKDGIYLVQCLLYILRIHISLIAKHVLMSWEVLKGSLFYACLTFNLIFSYFNDIGHKLCIYVLSVYFIKKIKNKL